MDEMNEASAQADGPFGASDYSIAMLKRSQLTLEELARAVVSHFSGQVEKAVGLYRKIEKDASTLTHKELMWLSNEFPAPDPF